MPQLRTTSTQFWANRVNPDISLFTKQFRLAEPSQVLWCNATGEFVREPLAPGSVVAQGMTTVAMKIAARMDRCECILT